MLFIFQGLPSCSACPWQSSNAVYSTSPPAAPHPHPGGAQPVRRVLLAQHGAPASPPEPPPCTVHHPPPPRSRTPGPALARPTLLILPRARPVRGPDVRQLADRGKRLHGLPAQPNEDTAVPVLVSDICRRVSRRH